MVAGRCEFQCGRQINPAHTSSPLLRLELVLWDRQPVCGLTPEGKLKYGTLENPAAWLEIDNLTCIKPEDIENFTLIFLGFFHSVIPQAL